MSSTKNMLVNISSVPENPKRLLLFLHGLGGNEEEAAAWLRSIRWPEDMMVVYPRGPIGPFGGGRYAWYFQIRENFINEDLLSLSVQKLKELIYHIRQKHDIEEVIISGFSQGGTVSLSLPIMIPGLVDRALVFAGYTPQHVLDQLGKDSIDTRFLWLHGGNDTENWFNWAVSHQAQMSDSGIDMEFHSYEGVGHTIIPEMIERALEWMND